MSEEVYWQCEKCGKIYSKKKDCDEHEKKCKDKKPLEMLTC